MVFPGEVIPQVRAQKHLVSDSNHQQVDTHQEVRQTQTVHKHIEGCSSLFLLTTLRQPSASDCETNCVSCKEDNALNK